MKNKILSFVLVVIVLLSISVNVFAMDHTDPCVVKPTIQTYSGTGAPSK